MNNEARFKAAILARQQRAEADQTTRSRGTSPFPRSSAAAKRWAVDDGREYPILTERAEAVARWIREAPTVSGTGSGKRKKKSGTKKVSSTEKLDSTSSQPESLPA